MKKYSLAAFCVSIWAILFGVPWLLSFENPPPNPRNLTPVGLTIDKVQDRKPNIYGHFSDGRKVTFSFASPLYQIYSNNTTVDLLSDGEKARLTGCASTVFVFKVRLAGTSPVWAIDCEALSVPYDRVLKHFLQANMRASIAPLVGGVVLATFAMLSVKRRRRLKE